MRPQLHVVLDPDVVGEDVVLAKLDEVLAALAASTVDVTLQLRIKRDVSRVVTWYARVEHAVVPIAINGIAAHALCSALAGVHLPEAEIESFASVASRVGASVHLPEAEIGAFTGAASRVGASVHSLEAIAAAQAASYVFFGPVFDPGSKPVSGVGLGALERACRSTTLPVVAIGGITPDRVPACMARGAAGIATLTPIFLAANPAVVIRAFAKRLEEATTCPI